MSLFGSMDISASGLAAERLRMDVTAENLANAQTTQGANGQPYRRKEVVLQQAGSGFGDALNAAMGPQGGRAVGTDEPRGVRVAAIVEDDTPNRMIYDPGHPDANPDGYVEMPNVDSVTEMVDLISAQRAYEANVTAMQTAKSMFTKTLELLR
jgi:flagellar basal-body rod protein FlgC